MAIYMEIMDSLRFCELEMSADPKVENTYKYIWCTNKFSQPFTTGDESARATWPNKVSSDVHTGWYMGEGWPSTHDPTQWMDPKVTSWPTDRLWRNCWIRNQWEYIFNCTVKVSKEVIHLSCFFMFVRVYFVFKRCFYCSEFKYLCILSCKW